MENHIAAFFTKQYPNLAHALKVNAATYNASLDFIKNPPANCRITQICPPTRLKVKRDTIDHSLLKEGYQVGVKSAQSFFKLNASLFA